MRYAQLPGGAIRFFGADDINAVKGLVRNDSRYTYALGSGHGGATWIDVFPFTPEDRDVLIGLVAVYGGGGSEFKEGFASEPEEA